MEVLEDLIVLQVTEDQEVLEVVVMVVGVLQEALEQQLTVLLKVMQEELLTVLIQVQDQIDMLEVAEVAQELLVEMQLDPQEQAALEVTVSQIKFQDQMSLMLAAAVVEVCLAVVVDQVVQVEVEMEFQMDLHPLVQIKTELQI